MPVRLRASLSVFVALGILVAGAASAPAMTVNNVYYSGHYIDGAGSTYRDGNGVSQPYTFDRPPTGVAIHQNSGHVLVFDDESTVPTNVGGGTYLGILSQFTGSGIPQPFSALGEFNTITNFPGVQGYSPGAVAVDNSPTPSNGNVYIRTPEGQVRGFDSTGVELGGNFPIQTPSPGCGIAVDPQGDIWVVNANGASNGNSEKLVEYNSGGSPTGTEISVNNGGFDGPCPLAIDTAGNVYVGSVLHGGGVRKYDSAGNLLYSLDESSGNDFSNETGHIDALGIDPSNNDVYVADRPWGNSDSFPDTVEVYSSSGVLKTELEDGPSAGAYPGLYEVTGIAVNGANHAVYVASHVPYEGPYHVEIYEPSGTFTIPDVTTEGADTPNGASAILHGTVNPDGVETTECHFNWGLTANYHGNSVRCQQGNVLSGNSPQEVTAELPTLIPGQTYHYQLFVGNAEGHSSHGLDESFKAQGPPEILDETVGDVNTDNARLSAHIHPGGQATTYHFEVGTDTSYGMNFPEPDGSLFKTKEAEEVNAFVGAGPATKLAPDTTYHYRVVAENALGRVVGEEQTFRTFATPEFQADSCPNAQVRQQTSAALLDDCRAYELVSAADAGGYDVQSDLVSGQSVLAARPEAHDKLLYSLHFGKVPGVSGSPTNYGLDPYVASRGPNGWSTSYVGLPADATPSASVFGSPLAGSDSGLTTFAFGGSTLCSPCFGDGSTGIPVRLPDGSLVQGMQGSLDPGPTATQAGYVGKALSADGSHLIFGSSAQFEPDGNSNGDVTIYERDLLAHTTTVVSKTPAGATMSGPGIAELDVSADGSHVLIGKAISTDGAGNTYWHPYMYVASLGKTIDLAPGTTSGVLYAGMTADGGKVFFTSPDRLTGDDLDNSADLYEARIEGEGATLSRLSTGAGAGNANSCNPAQTSEGSPWNNTAGADNCDVLAFAGGAGVSSGNGTVYFLSPEKLDGAGTSGAPNLFVVRPGAAPSFIATLEPDNPGIRNARLNNEVHSSSAIQVTPDGSVAVFASRLPLTEYPVAGHSEIYRYDESRGLECASCAPTRATATGDVALSSSGLNLTDDGRVFFTSPEQLVLRDTNGRPDAYEWENGKIQLVSTGADQDASGLLSVSADGRDAFFFTRQTIVHADQNGRTMKIYDAREEGGFPYTPPPVPCAASDECHGPASAAPAPSIVGTFRGSGGNLGEPAKAKHRCRRSGAKGRRGCTNKKRHRHHHRRQSKRVNR